MAQIKGVSGSGWIQVKEAKDVLHIRLKIAKTLYLMSVVDPDPDPELFGQVGTGSGIIGPDPNLDLTFLTWKSVKFENICSKWSNFIHILLENL